MTMAECHSWAEPISLSIMVLGFFTFIAYLLVKLR
jgi:hypothetical protein